MGELLRLGAEQTLSSIPTSRPVMAARSAAAGLFEWNKGVWGTLEMSFEALGLTGAAKYFQGLGKDARTLQAATEGDQSGLSPRERAVMGGFKSIGGSAPSLLAGVATGNPAVALGAMGVTTGGGTYGELGERTGDKAMTPAAKFVHSVEMAAFETLTERIPAVKLFEDLARGSDLLPTLIRQMASEVPGEQVATFTQDAAEWANLPENREKPLSAFVAERPSRAAETFISTLVATVGQTSLTHAVDRATRRPSPAEVVAEGPGGSAAAARVAQATEAALAPQDRTADIAAGLMGDLVNRPGTPPPVLPPEFAPVEPVEPDAPPLEVVAARPAVPPAIPDPMSPEGRAAIAASYANDPAQQAAVADLKARAAEALDEAPVRPRTPVEAPPPPASNAEILAAARDDIAAGKPVSAEDAEILRDLAREEADANAAAIDVPKFAKGDRVLYRGEVHVVGNSAGVAPGRVLLQPERGGPVVTPPMANVAKLPPKKDIDVDALLAEADELDAAADGSLATSEARHDGPTIEVIDATEGVQENASGESDASIEAQRRLAEMKARGEEFGYFDRAGRWTPVATVSAVDYKAQKGQTFGTLGPNGFTRLDDNGGRVPATLPKPTPEELNAIPGRQWTKPVAEMSDEELAAKIIADLAAEDAAAAALDAPAPAPTTLRLRIGGNSVAVDSLKDASAKFDALKAAWADAQGPGASDMPDGEVVDANGKAVARISQNGRVWPPGKWQPGMKELIETGVDLEQAKRRAAGAPQVTKNTARGSVEVKFPDDARPSAEQRAELKRHGFRWAKTNKLWYSKAPNAYEVANRIIGGQPMAKAAPAAKAAPTPEPPKIVTERAYAQGDVVLFKDWNGDDWAPTEVTDPTPAGSDSVSIYHPSLVMQGIIPGAGPKGQAIAIGAANRMRMSVEASRIKAAPEGTLPKWKQPKPEAPPAPAPLRKAKPPKQARLSDLVAALGREDLDSLLEFYPGEGNAALNQDGTAIVEEGVGDTGRSYGPARNRQRVAFSSVAEWIRGAKTEDLNVSSDADRAELSAILDRAKAVVGPRDEATTGTGRKTQGPPSRWSEIGKNSIGQTIYENADGVRSYIENGARQTEPVAVRPTRVGVTTAPLRTEDGVPQDTQYQLATLHPSIVDERPDLAKEVNRVRALPAPAPKAEPKVDTSDLEARKAANKAKRDELFAKLRQNLNKVTSGVDPADVTLMVGILRTYLDDGVTDARIAWRQLRADFDLADRLTRHFEKAWAILRSETVRVADFGEEAQTQGKGATDAARGGRVDTDQLSQPGRGTADARGRSDEGALDEVSAEDGGVTRERPGPRRAEGEASGRLPERPGTGERGQDDVAGDSGRDVGGTVPAPRAGDDGLGGSNPGDYLLTPAVIEAIAVRGPMERARDNLAAIRIIRALRAERRYATRAEQDTLAKYVGWGDTALASFLAEDPDPTWRGTERAIWQEIRDLTTEDERASLVRSSTNAHYTYGLYKPLWAALTRAGFTGGRVLEPAVGSGHAFGFMPAATMRASRLSAVELDTFTAAIAQALYPSARVQAVGYEDSAIARDTQDLVISNVPFGKFGITGDRLMPKFLRHRIHNYFFAKAMQHVRPGGLIVFVTSRYTMDGGAAQQVRAHLMKDAHFVGALRLPKTAFGNTAKTAVITDLVVLQKRLPHERQSRNADAFIQTDTVVIDGVETQRSRWYSQHPELVIGTEDMTGKMHARGKRQGEYSVSGPEDFDRAFEAGLAQLLPEGLYTAIEDQAADEAEPERVQAEAGARMGEYRLEGDTIKQVGPDRELLTVELTRTENGKKVPDKARMNRLRGMIGIRDKLRATVAAMRAHDSSEAEIKAAQKALKKAYDDFTRAYGLLNNRTNAGLFALDPESPNLRGLEFVEPKATFIKNKDGSETTKIDLVLLRLHDIFDPTKRPINAPRVIDKVDTPKDALLTSLGIKTRLDWPYMAKLLGQPAESIQRALVSEGLVYEQPDGAWVTTDEYLSGDVVTKLADAKAAAADDARFQRNVDALEAVQPAPKEIGDIKVSFGAHWVPEETLAAFLSDLTGIRPESLRVGKFNLETVATWRVLNADDLSGGLKTHELSIQYGPKRNDSDEGFGEGNYYTVLDAVVDALNLKIPALTYVIGRGDDRQIVTAPEASEAAKALIETVRERWDDWILEHTVEHQAIVDIYNLRFNRTVERVFDGSHLREVLRDNGYASWDLHPHQLNAIWRALATGNTLLAHEVGAGKTLEMIAIAMEMRRTGRANKPMITVPTYLIGQWRQAMMQAYPNAKVLAFDAADLIGAKRREAMSRIAFGEWDMVLVPHSSFELLKVDPATTARMLREWVTELVAAEALEREESGDDAPSVKELEARRRELEAKIEKILEKADKGDDTNITWEQLGVDALLVDEAHAFKNLYFHSSMDNIRGISRSMSDRAIDMFIKVRMINEQSGHRNLVLATATPVMNSLVEVYTMQRYLQPHRLKELGLESFDDWYRSFAEARIAVETQPDGSHREVMRAARFRNLDLLSRSLREVMDYVGWDDMPYLRLPKVAGNKVEIVETEPHPVAQRLKRWFAERLAVLKRIPPHMSRKEGHFVGPVRRHPLTGASLERFDNFITVMSDAKKAAIDARLVLGDEVTDFEGSRLQAAAEAIHAEWQRTKGTRGVSLAFLDMGTPPAESLEVMDFLRDAKIEDADAMAAGADDDAAAEDANGADESPEGAFNLYGELRRLLIKKGIPKREIVFVHQARNEAERLALFEAARTGRVRVVIGSTEKGGVGMSIQDNLTAMFEIDPPRHQRPGDLRQRLGRIIRQGNGNEFVRLVRFVTRRSTDEWTYGIIQQKSTMVEQVMRGEATEGEEDDPMSIEEAMIRASGDPRAIELTKLRGTMKRLQARATGLTKAIADAHKRGMEAARDRAASLAIRDRIAAWQKDHYRPLDGDKFEMTVYPAAFTQGVVYTSRAEANAALIERMRVIAAVKNDATSEVARVNGVPINAAYRKGRGSSAEVWLSMDRKVAGFPWSASVTSIEVPVFKEDGEFGAGRDVIASIMARYRDMGDQSALSEYERAADQAEAEAKRAQALIDQPHHVLEQARAAKARVEALEAELLADSKGTGTGSSPDGAVRISNEEAQVLAEWQRTEGNYLAFSAAQHAAREAERARKDAKKRAAAQKKKDAILRSATGWVKHQIAVNGRTLKVSQRGALAVHKISFGWEVLHPRSGTSVVVRDTEADAKAVAERLLATKFDWNTDTLAPTPDEKAMLAAAATGKKPTTGPRSEAAEGEFLEPYSGDAMAPPNAKGLQTLKGQPALPELAAFALDGLVGNLRVVAAFRRAGTRARFTAPGGRPTVTLRADLFKPGQEHQLAGAMAHEFGHWIDWLPEGDLRRGNVLGRLRTLHRFLKHKYTASDGETVKLGRVRDELKKLSAEWRPWPAEYAKSYERYRNSGKELYADAISALFNDPARVGRVAPTFYKEFFAELDAKPDAYSAYFDLQEALAGTPEQLIARRRLGVRRMFERGNATALELQRLKMAEREAARKDIRVRLRTELVDRLTPVSVRVEALERRGARINPDGDPRYLLKELRHLGAKQTGFLGRTFQPIYAALQTAGVDWTTFGEALFYERIAAGDRSDIANPRGITPTAARDMLADLWGRLTSPQRLAIDKAIGQFRATTREVAEQAYRAGLYKPELFKQMQENPAWASFRVIDYMHKDVTSKVYRQLGTLKEIDNPADATILKTLVTLRAIEYETAKQRTIAATRATGDVEPARQRWTGQGLEFMPPEDEAKALVLFHQRGVVRGVYVPKDVADALDNVTIGQNLASLEAIKLANSQWFRPVFTTMNAGFQVANFARDFWRYWSNIPTASLLSAAKNYLRAVPVARARAFGGGTDQARKDLLAMTEARILGVTWNTAFTSRDHADTQIEETFRLHGLGEAPTPDGGRIRQTLRAVVDFMQDVGDFIETLPKAAAVYELRGTRSISQLTAAERAYIREKVGSPDFLQGGTLKPITNELFLFSNAIVQAIRADIDVATAKGSRAAFWRKNASAFMVPVLLTFAVEHFAHLLEGDDEDDDTGWWRVARILKGVSEYDKTNYTIIPLTLDDRGNSVYLRLPRSDVGRMLGGVLRKALLAGSGNMEVAESLAAMLSYLGGQAPGLTPSLTFGGDVFDFVTGQQVYDDFRNREVFTRDEMDAGLSARAGKFLRYEFQQLGGGVVYRVAVVEQPEDRTPAQKVLELPVVSNLVGRFVRISNYGHTERLRKVEADIRRDEASARLAEREAVAEAVRGLMTQPPPLRGQAAQMQAARRLVDQLYADTAPRDRQDKYAAVAKKIRVGIQRGGTDPVVDKVLTATSTAQRVAIIREAFPDRAARERWMQRARREQVISEDVLQAVRREVQR